MKTQKVLISFFLALASTFMVSCSEDEDSVSPIEEDAAVSLSFDEGYVDLEFETIDMEIDFAVEETASNGRITRPDGPMGDCRVITIDEADNSILIDFGDGCQGRDGKLRKGKISVSFTGNIREGLRTKTSTFIDFEVDGNKIEGTRTRTVSRTENRERVEQISLSDGKITFSNGDVMTRQANWTRTVKLGEDNLGFEIHLEGSASGNCNEVVYTAEITETLVKTSNCFAERIPYTVKGIKKVTRGTQIAEINYGDGTCDNKATISANGQSMEIELGKRCERCGQGS